MQQVFAFEIDLRAAERFAQAFGVVERSRAAGVVSEQVREFRLKPCVHTSFRVRLFEFLERGHEDLGDKASAVRTEMAASVW